jgi:histone H3/H4
MAKSDLSFPMETTKRCMKKIGGATIVADDAAVEMSRRLEDVVEDKTQKALAFAKLGGRKTIKPEDVQYAFEGV